MDLVRILLARCKALFRRRKLDADLDDELHAHIELAIREHMQRGLPHAAAKQEALRAFGGVTQTRETYRVQRGVPFLESLMQDIRFALRQVRQSPSFAVTTTLILTLGIGINSAIFSVVHHVLLESLPFPESNRLYAIWARSDTQGQARIFASGPDFLDYHDQSKSFAQMAEMVPYFTESWTGNGEPKLLECTAVSDDFFRMLGIRPFMGRFYTAGEYAVLANPSILISYRFWKSQLGGDPNVIGRTLTIGGEQSVIIGVAPPLPDLFPRTDLWLTLTTHPSWPFMKWRSNKFLTVMGRLKPGVAPSGVGAELTAVLRRAPGEPPDVRVDLIPLKDDLVGSVRMQLRLVLLAVALVLIVACLNIAALLSVRSARRSVEMALRLSLGAGLGRLRQQLFVEGAVLTALACIPGVAVAWLALRLLPQLTALHIPRLDDVHLSVPALLATGAVAAATTLFFGWAPSLSFSSLSLASCFRGGRTGISQSHRRSFSGLVVAEIACSLVLSVCAGLLLHSYWRLAHVDPGFQPDHMLTTYLRTNYYSAAGQPFWANLLQGIETIPGVRAAALGDCTPGKGAAPSTLIFDDRPNDPTHPAPAKGCWISSDFFRVSGTSLLQGRLFNAGDNMSSPAVVLISEQAARAYWPGENPIGRLIGVNYTGPGRVGSSTPRMRRVVGIVQGMKLNGMESPTDPAVYMPYLQDETYHDMATMSLFVRSVGDPLALDGAIRARIHAARAEQPVDAINSMDDELAQSMAPRRYSLSLLTAFTALTLLLCAVGVYSIVSYATLQRTREFGIRIAVGATRGDVIALVFRHGLALACAGCALGMCAALLVTRILTRLLFEVSPFDTASFVISALLLGFVAITACVFPALRAARLDLTRALRTE